MDHALLLPQQLASHLKALRKARGLTQAQLGGLVGVGQVRIAEIEKDPAAISVAQLFRLVAALNAGLVLRDEAHASPRPAAPARGPGATRTKSGQW